MYRIEEFPDIWCDACLRDSEGRFLFLSVYGRDGSLMQFMAALDLGEKEKGVAHFHLADASGDRHLVDVGGTKRLAKQAGRLPRQNLFGPLSQLWLFDAKLQTPDRVNRIGFAMHYGSVTAAGYGSALSDLADRAWLLVKNLSPVALLDVWREQVMAWCMEKNAVEFIGSDLYPALGPVRAARVSLTDHFTAFVSGAVREHRLQLE